MFYMVFHALHDLTTTLQNLFEQEKQNCIYLHWSLYLQLQIVECETFLPWIRISPLKNMKTIVSGVIHLSSFISTLKERNLVERTSVI